MAGTWSLGKGACVGGNAGMWGARGGPKPPPSIGETPSRHQPQGTARTGQRGVFREGFLGYLYSHFIYNPNSKTEKINHMVDKFM